MSQENVLDALDLAALLCSRVCHDVISPVGAITNGLEVLEEDDSAEMRDFAFDLIKKSARQASVKLQFARLAFGAAGSAGAVIDIGDAETVARGMIETDKLSLGWTAERQTMPKNKIKLLLNLVLVAVSTIPRGGRIEVSVVGTPEAPTFTLDSTGTNARIPPALKAMLIDGEAEHAIDAHSVQHYYARQLAEAAGMSLDMAMQGEDVRIVAKSLSAVAD